MIRYNNIAINGNQKEDTIVRSLREFAISHFFHKSSESALDINMVWEDFLSNGSEPMNIPENETIFYNNVQTNYSQLLSPDSLNNYQRDFVRYLPNTTGVSPTDMRRRERRPRTTSQTNIENRCVFCSNNNEPPEVVRSHSVRDMHGRVLCPKLRTYVCPICNNSGDLAHTLKYCPQKPIITMEDTIMFENLRKQNDLLKKYGNGRFR